MPEATSSKSKFFRNGSVNSVMTPLNKMIWMVQLILGACTSGGVYIHAPCWILICFVCFMGSILLLYGGAYMFFMITDPSRLQTEEYNLEQQEMGYMYSTREDTRKSTNLTIPKKDPIETTRVEE
jgi:hypothetical protein